MRRRFWLSVVLIASGALPCAALAQYSVDWRTIDGGGGMSTGGPYSLSGTLGQPDALEVSLCSADGGINCVAPAYELIGGYWGGVPTPCGGGPTDCIFRDGFEIPP